MTSLKLNSKESLIIDYVKAIGIVLVVIGHGPSGELFNYYTIYSFHMPLFFFLGGLLIRPERSLISGYGSILKRHIFYLVKMYVFVGILAYAISHLYPIDIGEPFKNGLIETIANTLKCNFHNNRYFLVGWFLFAYALVIAVVFPLAFVLARVIKSEHVLAVASLMAAIILGYVGVEIVAPIYKTGKQFQINLLSQVMVGSCFSLIGFAARRYIWKSLNIYVFIGLFLFVYVVINAGYGNPLTMSWSEYPDGFLFAAIKAIAAIYSVFYIAKLLSEEKEIGVLRAVGSSSKSIMTFHLLALTLVDIFFYHLGVFDISKSSVLSHYGNPKFHLLYVAAGVILPVLAEKAYEKLHLEKKSLELYKLMTSNLVSLCRSAAQLWFVLYNAAIHPFLR